VGTVRLERQTHGKPEQRTQTACHPRPLCYPRDKKGGDKGVDGWFNYLSGDGRIKTGVISVKAGDNVNPAMVRDLGQVMKRDGHEFGLFIMKALPTRGMEVEAASHAPSKSVLVASTLRLSVTRRFRSSRSCNSSTAQSRTCRR
jgi:hypothetical protein